MKKLIILLAIFSTFAFAKSSIEVHGTSTLHDWKMVSQTLKVDFVKEGDKITKLDVGVIIDTLKSGDDGLDEKAYEALKISKFNLITFTLKSVNNDGTITGIFKVTDKEKETTLTPDVITTENVAGSFKVKMTEFDIEPPSVMFGTIRSGDEITIKYDIKRL